MSIKWNAYFANDGLMQNFIKSQIYLFFYLLEPQHDFEMNNVNNFLNLSVISIDTFFVMVLCLKKMNKILIVLMI